MVARLAAEMVVGVNSIHWLLWVTNVVSARNYLARRDVRKQKAVLGTDDNKHVYFKTQKWKQWDLRNGLFTSASSLATCSSKPLFEQLLSKHCLRCLVYYDACQDTLPWFWLELVTFETMQGWNNLVFSTLSCGSVKVRHSQLIFF